MSAQTQSPRLDDRRFSMLDAVTTGLLLRAAESIKTKGERVQSLTYSEDGFHLNVDQQWYSLDFTKTARQYQLLPPEDAGSDLPASPIISLLITCTGSCKPIFINPNGSSEPCGPGCRATSFFGAAIPLLNGDGGGGVSCNSNCGEKCSTWDCKQSSTGFGGAGFMAALIKLVDEADIAAGGLGLAAPEPEPVAGDCC